MVVRTLTPILSSSKLWFTPCGVDLCTNHALQVAMSRAFVNEDAGGWGNPNRRFDLPERDDPEFDKAAARALLDAAQSGDTGSAEMATGYYWGDPKLGPHVARLLERARRAGDESMQRAAERFLR